VPTDRVHAEQRAAGHVADDDKPFLHHDHGNMAA
jgi:hypothetical protein